MSRKLCNSGIHNPALSDLTVLLIPIQRLTPGRFPSMQREAAPGGAARTADSDANSDPFSPLMPGDHMFVQGNDSLFAIDAGVRRDMFRFFSTGDRRQPGQQQATTTAGIFRSSPRAAKGLKTTRRMHPDRRSRDAQARSMRPLQRTYKTGFSWRSAGWVPQRGGIPGNQRAPGRGLRTCCR